MTSARLCIALIALPLAGCFQTLQQVQVPESLLAECPHPVVDVRKDGGLAQGLLDYADALKVCNDDKRAIQEHLKPLKEIP